MKNKATLICITLFLFGKGFSQTSNWKWVLPFNGPSTEEEIDAVASDRDANVYISGKFEDTLYFSGSEIPLVSNGMADIMLIKYDSTGNHLWTKHFGGIGEDNVFDAVCDNDNNLIIGGYFQDTLVLDSHILISKGRLDGFMAKISPMGTVIWAISYGGSGNEGGNEISVDQNGNIFTSADSDSDLSIGAFSFVNTGTKDSYLIALNSSGVISWVRSIEGPGTVRGKAIAVDPFGNVLYGGDFLGPNNVIDESNNMRPLTSFGSHDAFLTSWTNTGDLSWSKSWGGNGDEICKGVTTNSLGEIYAVGTFENTLGFDSQILSSLGQKDLFLWKMDSQGNTIWLRQISGVEDVVGAEIETDGREGCVFGLGIKGSINLQESNGTTSIIPPPLFGANGSYPVFVNYDQTGDLAFTSIADSSYFGFFGEVSRSGNQFFVDAPYAGLLTLGEFSVTSSNKDAALASLKLPNLVSNIPQIEVEEVDFLLYPTLVDNFTRVELNNSDFNHSRIIIADINGNVVKTIITSQSQINIDLSNLKTGLYIVNLGNVSRKFFKL